MKMILRSGPGGTAAILLLALTLFGSACREAAFNGERVRPVRQAPEIEGTNWNGEPFSLSSLRGKAAVLFFGYTYCPDVCPLTLSRMKRLYEQLGETADDVAIVFISVDTERDTVEKLSGYIPGFDPRFYGLFLDESQLETTIADYAVVVERQRPPDPTAYYAVDHTATLFVVDPEGQLRLHFPHDAAPEQIGPDLLRLLGREGGEI